MILLAIAAVVLLLGFLGMRTSARSYVFIAAIAVFFSYIAYSH